MAAQAPFEGTTNLPSDAGQAGAGPVGARFFMGVWDQISGKFWAPRGTPAGNAIVQIEKGTVVVSHVTATTSTGVLLAANANRKLATFYNNGTDYVYIDSVAATTSSYAIPPGAEFSDTTGQGAWNVIAASTTQDVCVQEYS